MNKILTPVELNEKSLILAYATAEANIKLLPHMWWMTEQQQRQAKAMLENQQLMLRNMPGFPQDKIAKL